MTDRHDAAQTSGSRSGTDDGGSPDEGEDRDRLDEQEDESFPASDPHSDWAGPPAEVERP
jgi:hypothetical protein